MSLDFTEMDANYENGFFHYMAEISMECYRRGHIAAQIKTLASQYENISKMKEDPVFQQDQAYFTSRWQSNLPAILH